MSEIVPFDQPESKSELGKYEYVTTKDAKGAKLEEEREAKRPMVE
jgi:hypothetical protein